MFKVDDVVFHRYYPNQPAKVLLFNSIGLHLISLNGSNLQWIVREPEYEMLTTIRNITKLEKLIYGAIE